MMRLSTFACPHTPKAFTHPSSCSHLFPVDSPTCAGRDARLDSEVEMREVDRFICQDETGAQYEVIQWQEPVSEGLLAGDFGTAWGRFVFQTTEGMLLDPLDEENLAFKFRDSGITIRSLA